MEINRNNIVEITKEFGVKPDKDYGQNYLIDTNTCQKILQNLDILDNECVLEVGPGIGSLTHYFDICGCNYTGVDIDTRMIEFLKYHYFKSNMKFVLSDIRKFDVSNFDKICGNLPYNITTELIEYLLINGRGCKKMVLMAQSETFRHFSDIKGKEYGPISVLIHLLGNVKQLFNVKPGSFYPSPKCTSTVFEISLNEDIKDREKIIKTYAFARKMFLNRRKTILNNLIRELKDKEKTIDFLSKAGINQEQRPEEIPPEKFLELYKICYE